MHDKPTFPHTLLRRLIWEKAPTDSGFQLADAKDLEVSTYASRTACRLVLAGQLFRCKVHGHTISYHSTPAKADKRTASLIPQLRKPKPKKARVVKVKAVKPPRIIKVKPVKVKEPERLIIRKPWTPPKPRVNAEIVHTASTRYMVVMTPTPRYYSDVPRQRIGTANWLTL